MTSKERAALRAQANSLDALFQIGKGGISDSVIKQTEEALKARELIKVKILLESAPESPRETADRLAAADVPLHNSGKNLLFSRSRFQSSHLVSSEGLALSVVEC